MKSTLQTVLLTITFGLFTNIIFAAAGELDATFGTGGRVSTTMPGLETICFAAAMTGDNKTLVASNLFRDTNEEGLKIRITRYLSNGALDTSFDGDGILEPIIRMQSTAEINAERKNDSAIKT